jgi:hypothetical protein
MSSKGVGITVYPTSSFFQAVLPAGTPVETARINCADSQYATLYFDVDPNGSATSNVGFIIADQPFSGSPDFYPRGVENLLYLDASALVGVPAYQSNVYQSLKTLGVALDGQVSITIPVFGSYAFSLYLGDFGDPVNPATVTASVVLFKAI